MSSALEIELQKALRDLPRGGRIFVQGAAATPTLLLEGATKRFAELSPVELVHLHLEGPLPHLEAIRLGHCRVRAFFVGSGLRPLMDFDRVDYVPVHLSEMAFLMEQGRCPIDAALVQVSAPNDQGFVSLGTSVDIARASVRAAKVKIAQVNSRVPFTYGDGVLPLSEFTHLVHADRDLHFSERAELTSEDRSIGQLVADRIENGSTIQMGIGSVPDAVLSALAGHRDLGVHTEMFSDGLVSLIEKGIVTNSKKNVFPGQVVASFVSGSQDLMRFLDRNKVIQMKEAAFVNDPRVIAQNPKVVSINSAVEVDLTGQVCADSVGSKVISGVGGQMDFVQGAHFAGGQSFVAFSSITSRGESKIVSRLKPGAGVVTSRAHAQVLVTEYGLVDLVGLSLGERAKALIKIAHPQHRDRLQREWYDIRKSL